MRDLALCQSSGAKHSRGRVARILRLVLDGCRRANDSTTSAIACDACCFTVRGQCQPRSARRASALVPRQRWISFAPLGLVRRER